MREFVAYPWPLNFLVRWARDLWFRLRDASPSEREQALFDATEKAWGDGYRLGYADGERHAARLINRVRRAQEKEGA